MDADKVKLEGLGDPAMRGLITQQGRAKQMVAVQACNRFPCRPPDSPLLVGLRGTLRSSHARLEARLLEQIGAKKARLVIRNHIVQPGQLHGVTVEGRDDGVPEAGIDFGKTFLEIARSIVAVLVLTDRVTLERAVAGTQQGC